MNKILIFVVLAGLVISLPAYSADNRSRDYDSNRPVKEKIVKIIVGGASAASAFIGITFTPSKTGCAALHGC